MGVGRRWGRAGRWEGERMACKIRFLKRKKVEKKIPNAGKCSYYVAAWEGDIFQCDVAAHVVRTQHFLFL